MKDGMLPVFCASEFPASSVSTQAKSLASFDSVENAVRTITFAASSTIEVILLHRISIETGSSIAASDHRDALHLDEHLRPGEPGDGDKRAGRKIVAEDLAPQLGKAVAEPCVGENRGPRPMGGVFPPRLFGRAAKPGEHLANLAVKIRRQGAARRILDCVLTGEPDDPATLGQHRL